jgi:D-alanyl-D-alanine carboxypeptidase
MVYNKAGESICYDRILGNFTDEQCTNAFLSYMAEKCALYGMGGTVYANPSGLTTESQSTPQDEMKLAVAVAANRTALDVWATPARDFTIGGNNARTLSIINNVMTFYGATIDAAGYKFLGGKGGSLTRDGYDRAGTLIVDIQGVAVALGLMARGQTQYNDLDKSAKELCDMVKASLDGQTPTPGTNLNALVSGGGGYAACVIPSIPGAYANFESPADLLAREHSISASPTANRRPASTTKTMTMLCALDYMASPYDLVTVKTSDISTGSGSTFYDGDVLTMHDALRIMMMESSNTLANTIARETGRKILSYAV